MDVKRSPLDVECTLMTRFVYCYAFYASSAPPLRRNELKVDKNVGFKCQHYLLFVNAVVFLIIGLCVKISVGYIELYLANTYT